MIQKINGTINYDFFRIYSFALVEWLKGLDPLYRKMSTPQTINVIYGNAERMYASLNYVPSNERINLPIISVFLSGITPLNNFNIPPFLKFHKTYQTPSGKIDVLNSYSFSRLKAYTLTYTVDIWSEFKSDADYILYTITREFNDAEIRYLTIEGLENFQYIPIKLSSIRDTSAYEPGDASEVDIKWEIGLEILNAYLPVTTIQYFNENPEKFITEVNLNLEGEYKNILNSQFREAIQYK